MSRKRGGKQDHIKPLSSRAPSGIQRSDNGATDGVSEARRTKQLIVFLCGLLSGLIFHFASSAASRWFPQDDSLASRNSLLVSQQLDQLFRKIDDGVAEDPSRLQAYMGLLQVFYVYDRRFVEQNEGESLAVAETANASQRLGLCAKVFGDLEVSKSHYRKARQTLDGAIKEEPASVVLLRSLLDVQTTIADLERASGNVEAGRQEFDSALKLLREAKVTRSAETNEWLAPQFGIMASLAMQFGMQSEARDLAQRYFDSLQDLVSVYPDDEHWRKQAEDARVLLQQVGQMIPPAKT